MPSNNPASYPMSTPKIGSQYKLYFAESSSPTEVIDFQSTKSMELFSNTSSLSSNITVTDAEYFSVASGIKVNTSTMVSGEQNTFATPSSVAYMCAKTTNNYVTNPLTHGICILTALNEFSMYITRDAQQKITGIDFTINTIPATDVNIAIPADSTIAQVIEIFKNSVPDIEGVPIISLRNWVGDDSTIFNILPEDQNEFNYNEKVVLIDTHQLTNNEKSKYPSTITIVYPEINEPRFFNILEYNNTDPSLSFQFYGVRNKGFTFTFNNNGLTNFVYSQLGVGVVKQTPPTTIENPYYIDDYEKIYTQATYNTAPYWDGVYAGQMNDASINLEFDIGDELNITGLRHSYPNGKYQVGVSGGAVLNDVSYKQFFEDMANNKTPSFVLETQQIVNGISYQMMCINNYIKGQPTPVTLQPGALQLAFPSGAIGQVNNKTKLSNMFVFLHDTITNFTTNIVP